VIALVSGLIAGFGSAELLAKPAQGPTTKKAKKRLQLQQGKIVQRQAAVKGVDIPELITEAVVNASLSRVYALVRDCRNSVRLVEAVVRVKRLSHSKTAQRCRLHVHMPAPFSNLESVLDYKLTETLQRCEMSFRLRKGDYLRNRGTWTLRPFGADKKRTLVRYQLHCVPKTRAPDAAIIWGTRRSVKAMFGQLKRLLK